jgi:hypothetical protein
MFEVELGHISAQMLDRSCISIQAVMGALERITRALNALRNFVSLWWRHGRPNTSHVHHNQAVRR